jgi:hypothetical protein
MKKTMVLILIGLVATLQACSEGDGELNAFSNLKTLSDCNAENGTNYSKLYTGLKTTKVKSPWLLLSQGTTQPLTKMNQGRGGFSPTDVLAPRSVNPEDIKASLGTIYLPFANGESYVASQGWSGPFSHTSGSYGQYAIDFVMPQCTEIVAIAAGRVMRIKEDSNVRGSTSDYSSKGNYVLIDHGNGAYASYVHLCKNCALVEPGQLVDRGQLIGLSGHTGWSTDPHLHIQINDWATDSSYSKGYVEIPDGTHATIAGQNYTSQNPGAGGAYSPSPIPATSFVDNNISTYSSTIAWYGGLQSGTLTTISATASDSSTHVWALLMPLGGGIAVSFAKATVGSNIAFTPSVSAGFYEFALATGTSDSVSASTGRIVYVSD